MKLSSVSKLQSHSQSNHAAYHKSEIIMPSTHHHFYDLNFKLEIVAEVEAVKTIVKLLTNTAYWNQLSVNGETSNKSCLRAS